MITSLRYFVVIYVERLSTPSTSPISVFQIVVKRLRTPPLRLLPIAHNRIFNDAHFIGMAPRQLFVQYEVSHAVKRRSVPQLNRNSRRRVSAFFLRFAP